MTKTHEWLLTWGKRRPVYAWLTAIYPIISIAATNADQIALSDVLIISVLVLAATTLLVLFYRALFGSWHKAALAAALTAVLFYAYGPVAMAVDAWWLDKSDGGELFEAAEIAYRAPVAMSALWGSLLLCLVVAVWRTKSAPIVGVTPPLNLVAGVLVTFAIAQSVTGELTRRTSTREAGPTVSTHADARELPDIYYIVLDGYARADVLDEYYDHSNAPFLDQLRDEGFTVNDAGYANYYWTFLSLASSLNMDYVPAILGDSLTPNGRDLRIAYEAIRDNRVARVLREHGYRYIQLQSTWGATLANPHADVLVSCGSGLFVNEFFRVVAEASWLRALHARASANLASCHKTNFESLSDLGSEPGPKFVFAHFILPHHPYVFDRDGTVLRDATIANQFDFQARLWENRGAYLDQLLYVNAAVLRAVRGIRTNSQRQPVIILQSDHGPQLNDGLSDPERRQIRLANFAAYLTPGAPPELIPGGDSPVNLFRRVLNFYAGTTLTPLPNRHFYSPYRKPFALEDVTDLIYPNAGAEQATTSTDLSSTH